MFYYKSDQLKD